MQGTRPAMLGSRAVNPKRRKARLQRWSCAQHARCIDGYTAASAPVKRTQTYAVTSADGPHVNPTLCVTRHVRADFAVTVRRTIRLHTPQ